MDRATEHSDFLRYQASRRLLTYLFGGSLQANSLARFQQINQVVQDYMAQDAFTAQENTQ